MRRLAPLALLAALACNNNDNLIVGGVSSGPTTPEVIFDNIASAIHGVASLRDSDGNPVTRPMSVIMMSDRPDLCGALHAHPDYFRNAPEAYEALIFIFPLDYLGTFIIGRDDAAFEIVAASGPQVTTPFHALNTSYLAVTTFDDNGGEASGSFNMAMDDPYGTGTAHPFYGRFKTGFCPGLEGTLLP